VRKADLLITLETTDEALAAAMLFFQYYRENANYLERTYDFVERLGMDKIRKDTVYAASDTKRALLDRLKKSKDRSYDAWLERRQPLPAQFVQIQPMETVLV
jgi:nitrite reductase (NADH) large subunit